MACSANTCSVMSCYAMHTICITCWTMLYIVMCTCLFRSNHLFWNIFIIAVAVIGGSFQLPFQVSNALLWWYTWFNDVTGIFSCAYGHMICCFSNSALIVSHSERARLSCSDPLVLFSIFDKKLSDSSTCLLVVKYMVRSCAEFHCSTPHPFVPHAFFPATVL